MSTCHICAKPAVNSDAALCLTCSEAADRGEVRYDADKGWGVGQPEDQYLDADYCEVGDDDEDDGWDECGMTQSGQCTLAGTEWCDWDCPRSK